MKRADFLKFSCRNVTGGKVAGEAVLTNEAINFYLVDPDSGKIIEEGHGLEGESISDKIIVFPSDKGSSVVQLDGLFLAAEKGNKPKAFVVKELSTVLVSNSIIMEIPLVCDVEGQFYEVIQKGDWVEIEADELLIKQKNK